MMNFKMFVLFIPVYFLLMLNPVIQAQSQSQTSSTESDDNELSTEEQPQTLQWKRIERPLKASTIENVKSKQFDQLSAEEKSVVMTLLYQDFDTLNAEAKGLVIARNAQLNTKLFTTLEKTQKTLNLQRTGIQQDVEPFTAPGPFSGKRVYSFAGVSTLVSNTKREILFSLKDDPALIGFHDYVSEYFEMKVVVPANPCIRFGQCVDFETTEGLLNNIVAFIAKIKNKSLTVNLNVNSSPTEAMFTLFQKKTLQTKRETTTNDVVSNVYRGIYGYWVRKDGFKSIQSEINLIDDVGTALCCHFIKVTEPASPLPCVLRSEHPPNDPCQK